MGDWASWHERYEDPAHPNARRLVVVQARIRGLLDGAPAGPIRVIGMCSGDGRDLLGVLEDHPRRDDVAGRLVEVDPGLVERARRRAPPHLEVVCGDAGVSDTYEGAAPADLVMSCGVFGNISNDDIRRVIAAWRFLCRPGGTVIWTRGSFGGAESDLRPSVRAWVREASFEEISFDGDPEPFGVGVARMIGPPEPFRTGVRLFAHLSGPRP